MKLLRSVCHSPSTSGISGISGSLGRSICACQWGEETPPDLCCQSNGRTRVFCQRKLQTLSIVRIDVSTERQKQLYLLACPPVEFSPRNKTFNTCPKRSSATVSFHIDGGLFQPSVSNLSLCWNPEKISSCSAGQNQKRSVFTWSCFHVSQL